MNYVIACQYTHPQTGKTGCWLYRGDSHKTGATLSPVFADLRSLHEWMRANSWESVPGGNWTARKVNIASTAPLHQPLLERPPMREWACRAALERAVYRGVSERSIERAFMSTCGESIFAYCDKSDSQLDAAAKSLLKLANLPLDNPVT